MRRAFTLIVLLAFAHPSPADERASVRVEHHRGAAVGVGTGTVVAVDGGVALVLTNRHVCPDPGQAIVVCWPDGYRAFARWLAVDPRADLCALEAVAPEGCVACPPAAAGAKEGEPVLFYGYQGGRKPLRRLGVVLGFGGWVEGDPVFVLSVPSVPGDSGSGVLNARGELVGVVWGGTGRAQYVGRVSVIRFLRRPWLWQRFKGLGVRLLAVETPEPPLAPSGFSGVCPPGR